MSSIRGVEPLRFQLINHADLGRLNTLHLDHAERFLEPLAEILAFVRRGPAHTLIGILAHGALAGFYVVHPDRRDRACWWLGWLAIDSRHQGAGLGRAAMTAIMARLRQVHGCRRIRLLVAPDNAAALRLYERAGFAPVGTWPSTNELIMQTAQHQGVPSDLRIDLVMNAYSLIQAMWLRLWRRGAPPAAQLSGEFHGPPASNVSRCLEPRWRSKPLAEHPPADAASATNRTKHGQCRCPNSAVFPPKCPADPSG